MADMGPGEARNKKGAEQLACHDYLKRYAPHLLIEAARSVARPVPATARRFSKPPTDERYVALAAAFGCRKEEPFQTTDPDPEVSIAMSLSDLALTPIFDALGLGQLARFGGTHRNIPISVEMKANMVQATLAASHIQWPDQATFERHLPSVVDQFLTTRAAISLIDPTTRLQELDVRVFGSVARDEADEAIDVDLLVVPGPRTTLFDLSGFALDVEEIVDRNVDVVTPRGLKARIKDQVLAEAVVL
jgi:predicted nucleotidyltransferase